MSAMSRRAWRLACLLALCIAPAARAETISVGVDEARVMRLPQGASTVVIGNPLIADATLQNGGILVLTGKGYGATNLLALDRGSAILAPREGARAMPKELREASGGGCTHGRVPDG